MPKLVLKRFENVKHELFSYDVITKRITKGHAKTINTEKGYYSEGMETILNRDIETPFSKVLKYVDSIDYESDSFGLFPGFEKAVKDFLKALYVRNPMNVDDMEKQSDFFQLLDVQSRHDVAVWMGMEEVNDQKLFAPFIPTFSVNRSSVPFVLPICGYYGFTHNGIKHLNLPIDPWTAITLIDKHRVDTITKDGLVHIYLITAEKQTDQFNRLALENQRSLQYGSVVSNSREILERLINNDRKEKRRE